MSFVKSVFVAAGIGLLLVAASCANPGVEPGTDAGSDAPPIGPCGPGTAVKCGDTCVDTQSNAQNCGACGKACAADLVCSHGACATVCATGTIHCGNDCIDQGADVNNCGGCGKKCPSGNVCSKGSCELTCQEGLTNCNGNCVDVTQNDDNCGACGSPCPGGQVCSNSKCIATCQSPWTSCPVGDAGATTCVDVKNDPQNCNGCGLTCPQGQFCSNGTCSIQCGGGTSLCSGACVDENIDKNHCGSCTTVCSGVCSAAHCCSVGQVYCGGCDTLANCITKSSGRLAAGYSHACALTALGALKCWGDDFSGALGDDNPNTTSLQAVSVHNLTSVTGVGAGNGFTCAIASSGGAYCWGDAFHGELGDGDPNNEVDSPGTAIAFVNNLTPKQIEGGNQQGCALMTNGSVQCWGYNEYGEVGDGTQTERDSPVTIALAATASFVDTGAGQFTCALLTSGAVQCWGNDDYGQCGDGTNTTFDPILSPSTVGGLANVKALSVGSTHACAIKADGTVWCWGDDEYGELGDGGTNLSAVPVQAIGVSNALAVAAGGDGFFYNHTCALIQGGAVVCWGSNDYGELGDGTMNSSATPVTAIASGAVAIAAGSDFTCAVKSDNTVWCWGYNGDGELGDNTGVDSLTPVQVVNF